MIPPPRQRRAPRRQYSAPDQIVSVSRRRKSQLPPTLSIPPNIDHLLRLVDQRTTDLKLSQPPTILYAPQVNSNPARKRKLNGLVDTSDKKPLKRAKLTARNLQELEKGGRKKKFAAKKSSGEPLTTTTTGKYFDAKLQQNGIVYRTWEARKAVDVAEIRELLDRPRASEPPSQSVYRRYLRVTEDYDNGISVEYTAYPLLTKWNKEAELSGYIPRLNHLWSAVDNSLTKGLNDAQPDLAESYCATDYPRQAVDALSGNLAPSSYNESMATYTVEFKSSSSA